MGHIDFFFFCMNHRGLAKVQRLGVRWMPGLSWKRGGEGTDLCCVY